MSVNKKKSNFKERGHMAANCTGVTLQQTAEGKRHREELCGRREENKAKKVSSFMRLS